MNAERVALNQAKEMRATRLSQRDDRIRELYDGGLDVATIGSRVGMCRAAISCILRKHGVVLRRLRKENLSCARPVGGAAFRVAPHSGMDGGW